MIVASDFVVHLKERDNLRVFCGGISICWLQSRIFEGYHPGWIH